MCNGSMLLFLSGGAGVVGLSGKNICRGESAGSCE
jgi:hypothetical protein